MHEINKEEFIANTAANVFAQMFNNKEKVPDPKKAVKQAYLLWEELVAKRGLVE